MGTNRFDSQRGMKAMGGVRHIADIKADSLVPGDSHIGLQSGTNKFASQSGMRGFGAFRRPADIKVTDLLQEAGYS